MTWGICDAAIVASYNAGVIKNGLVGIDDCSSTDRKHGSHNVFKPGSKETIIIFKFHFPWQFQNKEADRSWDISIVDSDSLEAN